jgi:hypothetical protein
LMQYFLWILASDTSVSDCNNAKVEVISHVILLELTIHDETIYNSKHVSDRRVYFWYHNHQIMYNNLTFWKI